ncbi:MAG: 4-phosphoerythronate dehydrogenase [Bacteroidales bacterium]|nr:4-phosphoerythronate dehydrogenase [Bacteroidales bacterium]
MAPEDYMAVQGDRLRIVADSEIPFLNGVFEPYASVRYIPGTRICREDCADADVLVTTTRTKCTRELLEGSDVRLIAAATIGEDNIDTQWCRENGIDIRNAAGCNSGAVMNYVFSALYGTASRKSISLKDKTIGIIGAGNVGSKVASVAMSLGFRVLLYDPPREKQEGSYGFVSLDELLEEADIVTLHVPLDETTRGMAGRDFFMKIKPGAFFINTSRGEIVDEKALKDAAGKLGPLIIDTWSHEPDIDRELLELADIATPHIAGYSYQGKLNATSMAVRAVARFYSLEPLYEFFPQITIPELKAQQLDLRDKNQGEVAALLQYNYPIFTDDIRLRMAPDEFESLRNNYQLRGEFYTT